MEPNNAGKAPGWESDQVDFVFIHHQQEFYIFSFR